MTTPDDIGYQRHPYGRPKIIRVNVQFLMHDAIRYVSTVSNFVSVSVRW